jgi:hypothetical protein
MMLHRTASRLIVLLMGVHIGFTPMVATVQRSLNTPRVCDGTFIAHDLDHKTIFSGPRAHLYDSDGAGVAVGDLNNDGQLDIVLANLNERSTILWNEGDFRFRKETLADGNARAAAMVDVDGDGWLDIVFTHSLSGVTYWHNRGTDKNGKVAFTLGFLPGVRQPAYAMNWADINSDGALDLVTGSYDSDLEMHLRDSYLFGEGAGVFIYVQKDGQFIPTRLAKTAQALALMFMNLGDGLSLMVGNDFTAPDQVWSYQNGRWTEIHPFKTLTRNTMSLDIGDLDNDGLPELFAADMKPYSRDAATTAAWKPVLDSLERRRLLPGDPQISENVLQMRGADGQFSNKAREFGVDATGWSWSAQFGDLDNDGFLDLYVVNGMTAVELFHHLPGDELVEENQAFRNLQGRRFVPMPTWKLNSTRSGRGMTVADLNGDGRLDMVVNNLNTPAQIFENRLCGGSSLEIDLRWPSSRNTRSIGAQLTLRTDRGTYYRDVRAASGYLSGDPARIHFGFPTGSVLISLDIRWPDGALSEINPLTPDTLLTVTRPER